MQRGIFIVLEGTDGSGKATQLKLLQEHLSSAGHDVIAFDFPRYNQPSSYFVKQYLAGAYGPLNDISPYTSSLFYALDRYAAANELRTALQAGKIVIANRFTASNMAHQGSKIMNAQERSGFYIWLDNLEFQLLSIPRPTVNLILKVPAQIRAPLIEQRANGQPDLHEQDSAQLNQAALVYDELAQLFPQDFQVVDCVRNNELLAPDQIHQLVWGKVEPMLPVSQPKPEPIETKNAVTATPEQRFSLLGEARIRTQRLAIGAGKQAIVPDIAKDWFYIPEGVTGDVRNKYVKFMESLHGSYGDMVRQLQTHWEGQGLAPDYQAIMENAQFILPLATKTPVSLALNSEKKIPTEAALAQVTQPSTTLVEIVNGSLASNHVAQGERVTLARFAPRNESELVPEIIYDLSDQPLEAIRKQIASWPKSKKVETLQAYITAVAEQQGSSLLSEQVRYEFDIVIDFMTLRRLQAVLHDVRIDWQHISPRLGYDTPELIETVGLSDVFEACYDASLKVYSDLQAAGLATEAQYVVLLGHKLRCRLSCDYIQLKRLFDSAKHSLAPVEDMILQAMRGAVARRHTTLGKFLV